MSVQADEGRAHDVRFLLVVCLMLKVSCSES